MKVLVVVAILATVSNAVANTNWENFKTSFGKNYRNVVEEKYRQNVFLENLKTIEEHNARFEKGEVTFTLGINQFADMTSEEFVAKIGKSKQHTNSKKIKPSVAQIERTTADNNDTFDWRQMGCPLRNEDHQQCVSDLAWLTVLTLEEAYCAGRGIRVALSEQNLIDCTWEYGNLGCDGGFIEYDFQYVYDNGIDTEEAYPYTGQPGMCHYNPVGAYHISGFVYVKSGCEDCLKNAVPITPVLSAIDASSPSFQLYAGGIYDNPLCSQTELDLGVLVMGYGVDNGLDYWLVFPPGWGTNWGEFGYIRMSRNKNNQCGIATDAGYPTI